MCPSILCRTSRKPQKLSASVSIIIALLGCICVGFLATGCTENPLALGDQWLYSDLRSLDAIDAVSPEIELLALYSRKTSSEFHIRLDFLNVATDKLADIYLFFDVKPGGTDQVPMSNLNFRDGYYWDVLLNIEATGKTTIYNDKGEELDSSRIKIFRDTFLDAVFISFSPEAFSYTIKAYTILAIATSANASDHFDTLGPSRSDAPPPLAVPLLLVFWDMFQPTTPAQALRSWDGAHTGPDSGRHGLRYLVDAAETSKVPLLLLGLDNPVSRSAMSYLGIDKRFDRLKQEGLLLLSDYSLDCLFNGYTQYTIVVDTDSATVSGLSQTTVITVMNAAFKTTKVESAIIIIGGSLRDSNWGTPGAVSPTLAYIVGHPWIKLVNRLNLQRTNCELQTTSPISSESYVPYINNGVKIPSRLTTAEITYRLIQAYNNIERNRISELAWDTYTLLKQTNDPKLDPIRNNYIGQIGHILAAARWINSPAPLADCSIDIDWDEEVECILATDHIFTTYELSGGYLAFAFTISENGPHQIIGPTYQLSVGLSDPSVWNAQGGFFADPEQILGAFADSPVSWQYYDYRISEGMLEISTRNMAIRKSFKLTNSAISILVTSPDSSRELSIPFVLDPWLRFNSNWTNRYIFENLDHFWLLSATDEVSIHFYSSFEPTITSFLTPWNAMLYPEDPNYDYTLGYFLPFPMTLVEVQISGTSTIDIQLVP